MRLRDRPPRLAAWASLGDLIAPPGGIDEHVEVEHFTTEGQWWLPDQSDRRVPGTLTFNADGLELVLYAALREFEMLEDRVVDVAAPDWEVEPVLHGRARDGRDFTLLEVGGANLKAPFQEVTEVYRPAMALAGCHTRSDLFSEVWCDFDYLDAWADPPSITDGDHRDDVSVRLASVDIAQVQVQEGLVRLVTGVQGTAGGVRVDLTRWTSFAVTPPDPRPAKDLVDSCVRPLQDLLMLCLGRSVRLTSLRLMPIDLQDRREGFAEAFFSAIQPPASRTPTFADIENYTAPTILSLRQAALAPEDLVRRWFHLWPRYREVVTLLHSPLYAPFMYSEHGFASTFQSAEALHDRVLPTRDVEKVEHRRRVDDVISALGKARVDEAVIEWASSVLRSKNDKPLWRKIEDLVKSTGAVGDAVLAAEPAFGRTTAAARTGVSHGGATRRLDAVARYWYGQALRWVVRTRLLMELLDDDEEAQRRVLSREPFRRCLKEIGAG